MPTSPFNVRNGWRLYMYPAFQSVYDGLVGEVARLAAASPDGYASHPKTKLLARINKIILDEIPADPGHKDYRLGKALGGGHKNWFRAKFLKGRFRLFYRYDSSSKVIIFCWTNDENTLRKEGSRTDPYVVFKSMLESGKPPSDWGDLVEIVVGSTKCRP